VTSEGKAEYEIALKRAFETLMNVSCDWCSPIGGIFNCKLMGPLKLPILCEFVGCATTNQQLTLIERYVITTTNIRGFSRNQSIDNVL
jgi:hypothetical protein